MALKEEKEKAEAKYKVALVDSRKEGVRLRQLSSVNDLSSEHNIP